MPAIDTAIDEPTEAQFDLADAIVEFLETTEFGTDFSPSQIARKLPGKPVCFEVREVLDWMERHQYVISNERGGCWRRYGRRK